MEPETPTTPPVPPAPVNNPVPVNPTEITKPASIKNSLLLVMGILLIFAVLVAGFFYFQMQKLSKNLTQNQVQTTSTPAAIPDPTLNWTASTATKISFKFPNNLALEERQKNYFVLLSDAKNPMSVFVSVDARLTENYLNYEKAVTSTKSGLTEIQTQELDGGLKISGKIGPGFGQGQPITVALLKYDDGAIKVETTATDSSSLKIFDQILSTFKFVEATPSASPTSTPVSSQSPSLPPQ